MKGSISALYWFTFCWLTASAQNYIAPPPLLPNPAQQSGKLNEQQSFVAPETNPAYSNLNSPSNNGAKTHLVKKGESLYKIAQLYKVTVDDIRVWNYLQSDLIAAGRTLSIGAMAPNKPEARPAAVPASYNEMTNKAVPGWLTNRQVHTVLNGESLGSIAVYYGLTEERLRYLNNLDPQAFVPAGSTLNVDPCANPSHSSIQTSNLPAPYEQPNSNTYSTGNNPQFSATVPPYFAPYDRFANSNQQNSGNAYQNPPSSYGYNAPAPTYRREDPYDPNNNLGAVPNSYEYGSRSAPANTFNNGGNLTQENGRRVFVVGSFDTIETIADQFQIPAERIRMLNNLGLYDIIRPNQRLFLD